MNKTFTLLEISNAVCNYYGISEKTLLKNDRNRNPIIRKQLFFYFCREFTNESYPSIGKYSGYNHANVIHSVNKILIERGIYPDIKKDIKEMQYYWHCKNGNASGSIICDCTVSEVISMVSFWC